MNKNADESTALASELIAAGIPENVRVMIAPATVFLDRLAQQVKGTNLEVVSQNMNAAASGAFTGEISLDMLESIGVKATILGHSERRAYYNETDESLAEKVTVANVNDMEIVFCFGEELADRKAGTHFDVVANQLDIALFQQSSLNWEKVILAYEPVWAIGTGETASPAQAQEMHAHIRQLISENVDSATAAATSILYGGSVKPANAQELFSQPDVDGGLIGGASLEASDFMAIVNAI